MAAAPPRGEISAVATSTKRQGKPVPKPDLSSKECVTGEGFHFCPCPELSACTARDQIALSITSSTFTLVSQEVLDLRMNVPRVFHMKCISNEQGGNLAFGFLLEDPGDITTAAIGNVALPKSVGISIEDNRLYVVAAGESRNEGVPLPMQGGEVLLSLSYVPAASYSLGRFICKINGEELMGLSSLINAAMRQVMPDSVASVGSPKTKNKGAADGNDVRWRLGVSFSTEGQCVLLGDNDDYSSLVHDPAYEAFLDANQHRLNVAVTKQAKAAGFETIPYRVAQMKPRDITFFVPALLSAFVRTNDSKQAVLSLSDAPTTAVTTHTFKIPMVVEVTFRILALPPKCDAGAFGFGIIGKNAVHMMTSMVGSDDRSGSFSIGLVQGNDGRHPERCSILSKGTPLEDDPQFPNPSHSFRVEDKVTLRINNHTVEFLINDRPYRAATLKDRKIYDGNEVRFAVTMAGVGRCVCLEQPSGGVQPIDDWLREQQQAGFQSRRSFIPLLRGHTFDPARLPPGEGLPLHQLVDPDAPFPFTWKDKNAADSASDTLKSSRQRDVVVATDQIFRCHSFDNVTCSRCFQRPLYCTQWVHEAIVLCDDCYRSVQKYQYPPELLDKDFRSNVGGSFSEVKFQVLDLAVFPLTIGMISALDRTGPHVAYAAPGHHDDSVGLILRLENPALTFLVKGRPVATLDVTAPIRVNSTIHLRLITGRIQFLIDDVVVAQHGGFSDRYRFAVCLPATSDTRPLLRVLPNPSRPKVGFITTVTANKEVLVNEAKNCGFHVEDRWASSSGRCVAVDDDAVGLVFPKSAGKVFWFPRVCVSQNVDPGSTPQFDYRPSVGDQVQRHPVHWRGGDCDAREDSLGRPGVVTDFDTMNSRVQVKWENGDRTWHQWGGIENRFEVIVVVGKGCRVKRNPFYWMWGDQDGGGLGTVENVELDGQLRVKWDANQSVVNTYRFGIDKMFDVQAASCPSGPQSSDSTNQSSVTLLSTASNLNPNISDPSSAEEDDSYVSLLSHRQSSNNLSHVLLDKQCMIIPIEEIQRDYNAVCLLGQGSFGKVWKWTWNGKEYAIKDIRKGTSGEALLMSKLSHPNIVRVYGLSSDAASLLVVMELVDGGDLATLLKRTSTFSVATGGPLGWAGFYQIAIGVAKGLSYLTERNLAHRDLKPANIMIDSSATGEWTPKIGDFGLAREQMNSMAHQSKCCGTYAYMSPEMVKTDQGGPISDVYSFGIILREMLTGEVPRHGMNQLELMNAIVEGPPLPPIDGVDPKLNHLIAGCLARAPMDRPKAHAVLHGLEGCFANSRVSTGRAS